MHMEQFWYDMMMLAVTKKRSFFGKKNTFGHTKKRHNLLIVFLDVMCNCLRHTCNMLDLQWRSTLVKLKNRRLNYFTINFNSAFPNELLLLWYNKKNRHGSCLYDYVLNCTHLLRKILKRCHFAAQFSGR